MFDGHWAIHETEHGSSNEWLLFLSISGDTVVCGDATLGCLKLNGKAVSLEGGELFLDTKDTLRRVGKSGRAQRFSRVDMQHIVFSNDDHDNDGDEVGDDVYDELDSSSVAPTPVQHTSRDSLPPITSRPPGNAKSAP